jgi:hypothetical protein
MYHTITVLRAVSNSNSSLASFLKHLPDRPVTGEKAARIELSRTLGALEDTELITVRRDHSGEPMELTLTDLGRERLQEADEELQQEGVRREQRRQLLGLRG